jgi:hypothetical protein
VMRTATSSNLFFPSHQSIHRINSSTHIHAALIFFSHPFSPISIRNAFLRLLLIILFSDLMASKRDNTRWGRFILGRRIFFCLESSRYFFKIIIIFLLKKWER